MLHLKALRSVSYRACLLSWFLASAVIADTNLPSQFGHTVNTDQREVVRQFYNVAYSASNQVDPEWSGDVSACDPGTISDAYQQASIRRINWFRAMSGVPAEVSLDESTSIKAQQAALMMTANQNLTHYPPENWHCYTAEGSAAAASSTLSLGSAGPDAVTSQFRDHGSHNTEVGHRRWLVFPITPSMGVGSVVPESGGFIRSGIVWVMNFLDLPGWWNLQVPVRDEFVAWPPPGYIPYPVVYPRWSFSYDGADFSNASVVMLEDGQPLDVHLEPVGGGAGLNTLVWIPAPYKDGDTWAAVDTDRSYEVQVRNVGTGDGFQDFEYSVTIIDPRVSLDDQYQQAMLIDGPATLPVNQSGSFTATGLDFADSYRWRLIELLTVNRQFQGDPALDGLEVSQSAGYSVINYDRVFSGGSAYHLAHPEPVDQSITLTAAFVPDIDSHLSFYSYLGYATPRQSAVVELSPNEGQDWVELWRQTGNHAPVETEYTLQSIGLADFANQSVKIRFRYEFSGGGSYYPQTDSQMGWFIDNIHLQQLAEIQGVSASYAREQPELEMHPESEGVYGLQLQPLLFGGFPGDWGEVKRLEIESAELGSEPVRRRGLPVWLYIINQ